MAGGRAVFGRRASALQSAPAASSHRQARARNPRRAGRRPPIGRSRSTPLRRSRRRRTRSRAPGESDFWAYDRALASRSTFATPTTSSPPTASCSTASAGSSSTRRRRSSAAMCWSRSASFPTRRRLCLLSTRRDAARVTIIALTDSAISPLARRAKHTLLFRTESVSFIPSMIAPLALVELLLAQLAARGGKSVTRPPGRGRKTARGVERLLAGERTQGARMTHVLHRQSAQGRRRWPCRGTASPSSTPRAASTWTRPAVRPSRASATAIPT